MQLYNVAIEEVPTVNRFCKAIGEAVIVAEVRLASGQWMLNGRLIIYVQQAEKLASMVERGVELLRNRNLK